MGLWVTPNVSPPASQTNRDIIVEERDFYRAERVLPSSCQDGLSAPPQAEPGLRLSIANEAKGRVFTKKPPGPELGLGSGPSAHADGVKALGIGAGLWHSALERRNPHPCGCSRGLVQLEPSGARGGGREAKADGQRGTALILTLLPAHDGARRGGITRGFLGFGVGTACELRHELLVSRL